MIKLQISERQLLDLWNAFCEDDNCFDDRIWFNDQEYFDMHEFNVRHVSTAVKNNRYNFDHKWATLDGYANPISSNELLDFVDYDLLMTSLKRDAKDTKYSIEGLEKYRHNVEARTKTIRSTSGIKNVDII